MRLYLLQIIYNDYIGTIKTIKAVTSKTKAEKWFKKRLKTKKYLHGYQTIDIVSYLVVTENKP